MNFAIEQSVAFSTFLLPIPDAQKDKPAAIIIVITTKAMANVNGFIPNIGSFIDLSTEVVEKARPGLQGVACPLFSGDFYF